MEIPARPAPAGGTAHGGRILVADGDPVIAETVCTMLRYRGYEADEAATSREVLAKLRERIPDLLLVDLDIPEHGGIELCRRVVSDPGLAGVRVLMLAPREARNSVVEALEAGASDSVAKPFFIDELLARIRTNLEVKRHQEDLAAMLRISQAVLASLEPGRVFHTIVRELAHVVESDRVSLVQIADSATGFVVVTREDPDLSNRRIDLVDYPEIVKAARERSAIVIDDSHADPLLEPVREKLPFRKSIMIVPVEVGEDLGSYVLRSSRAYRPYSDREIQIARVVAGVAANGLANAALFARAESDKAVQEQLANTDDLTKLYNHRHFYRRLDDEYKRAERYRSDLSLVLLDIDHFKRVNDAWGHQSGDDVLRELAMVLGRGIRETDMLARYGGEEFALLLPETNLTGAHQQAERLRRKVRGHYFEALDGEPLTISCGVACLPFGEDPDFSAPDRRQDTLISLADNALYTAKRAGRDRTVTAETRPEAEPAE